MSYLDVDQAKKLHDRIANSTDAVVVKQISNVEVVDGGGRKSVFIIHHESHTIGNLLRYELNKNPMVEFVGYVQKHPLEPNIHINMTLSSSSSSAAADTTTVVDEHQPRIVLRNAIHNRYHQLQNLRTELRK